MKFWLVVTSYHNFKHDREELGFKLQGLPYRYRKQVQTMKPGDKVLYYIMKKQKFGAIATITGEYFEDDTKIWLENDEMWPSRCPSEPNYVLNDDELLDIKRFIEDLSFITNKDKWGVHLQGSIKQLPEEDFKLVESEIKRIVNNRPIQAPGVKIRVKTIKKEKSESDYIRTIERLPLEARSLHDKLGEMLEQIGSWMDYNVQTKHKITKDHAYELDVAWLTGLNPEIAIEIQISGNLTEAKDRLAQARKFNYRKVIMVLKSSDMERLNKLMRHEPELRSWMEAWSIGAVCEMYMSGEQFFKYYKQLEESRYIEKEQLEFVE